MISGGEQTRHTLGGGPRDNSQTRQAAPPHRRSGQGAAFTAEVPAADTGHVLIGDGVKVHREAESGQTRDGQRRPSRTKVGPRGPGLGGATGPRQHGAHGRMVINAGDVVLGLWAFVQDTRLLGDENRAVGTDDIPLRPQDRDAVVRGCVSWQEHGGRLWASRWDRGGQGTSAVAPCRGAVSVRRPWWPEACGGWKHGPQRGGRGVRVGCPMGGRRQCVGRGAEELRGPGVGRVVYVKANPGEDSRPESKSFYDPGERQGHRPGTETRGRDSREEGAVPSPQPRFRGPAGGGGGGR